MNEELEKIKQEAEKYAKSLDLRDIEQISKEDQEKFAKEDYEKGASTRIPLLAEIERLKKESEWISVEKELPDERMLPCLVANMDAPEYNQHVFTATWFNESKSFSVFNTKIFKGTITHWKPLPEPPKK